MKVLVIGGGGREHALCSFLKSSTKVTKLWCVPGNAGISGVAECLDIKATDLQGILEFCKCNNPDLVVVAPDDPLAMGLVDVLNDSGFYAFGPSKNAAVIEGSKAFAKHLMKKYNIPTAGYEVFENSQDAIQYVRSHGAPVVVKADGLALGKGVTVCETIDQAIHAIKNAMEDKAFGQSGARVVIEEFLTGPEVSVLAFTDGKTLKTMPSVQDHKRAYDGDHGPNTGGMGAFCPSRVYTREIENICMRTIFLPTIHAMNAEDRKFKGVLYFGLMLTDEGPKVIEYNARFGDPETQAVLPLLETDPYDIFCAVIDEKLSDIDIKWKSAASCCVVIASGGYPVSYEKGRVISGIEDVSDAYVFHAGTALSGQDICTSGGRVLGISAVAKTLDDAIIKAYIEAEKIHFDGMHYRKDIGRN